MLRYFHMIILSFGMLTKAAVVVMEATAVTEVVTAAVEVVDAVAVVVAVSGEDGKQLHKDNINYLDN